eukprot:COSAG05_NODE_14955_length_382_cov_0.901060_2_plen_34_part_01
MQAAPDDQLFALGHPLWRLSAFAVAALSIIISGL